MLKINQVHLTKQKTMFNVAALTQIIFPPTLIFLSVKLFSIHDTPTNKQQHF